VRKDLEAFEKMSKTKQTFSFRPICFVDGPEALVIKKHRFFLFNCVTKKLSFVCDVPLSRLRSLLTHFRLATRRYGLDSIIGCCFSGGAILLIHHLFYHLDFNNRTLTLISDQKFSSLKLVKHKDFIYFGDYGYNPDKKKMSLWKISLSDYSFSRVFTFADGQINHIHNIIFDELERPYVFTGDFGNSAAIYLFDKSFLCPKILASGSQLFRSCVAFFSGGALYYATDTPMEQNYLMKYDGRTFSKVQDLPGSVIYGGELSGGFVFSTTIENESNEMNNKKNAFRYNRGKGIADWYARLYYYNYAQGKLTIIDRRKKDILPMLAFKFGCYIIPDGRLSSPLLVFGQSLKKVDGKAILFGESVFIGG
jgi:hypothetical protein